MTDMIQRLAGAIREAVLQIAQNEVASDFLTIDEIQYKHELRYKRLATAAITEMRDCTPAMLDAGSAAHPTGGYVRGTLLTDIIEAEWRAMCDAALEEK